MNTASKNPCPCHSGKAYEQCCKPFHEGTLPENALLLMRSRYAAYALNIADYIIDTTHPANPQYNKNRPLWKETISQRYHSTKYINLEIHDFKERGSTATVTFTAYLTHNGNDAPFTEKSVFEKVKGRWLYRSGQILNFFEKAS